MKLELKDIPETIKPYLARLRKYLALVVFMIFMGMYGFLVLRINTLASAKPSDAAVTEKLKTVQRPRVDERAAEKMQKLEDQNVSIQTLFNEARQNPFAE